MTKVFIVGWDGATFDLIKPWIDEGKLPNIARVIDSGTHGLLRSTVPPWTFPAWSSFMTGVNPGKHGIFDFTRRREGKYDLEFVNGGQRKAPTFWRLLSDAGKDVVSISVPCTYPPEKVQGVMISGFDAPGMGGKGAHADARGMHPTELHAELEQKVGGHPMGAFIINEVNRGRPDQGLLRVLEVIKRKSSTAKYLLQNKPWDCFMILFGESDGVGHHFWKYCDPNSPLFTEHASGLRDAIERVYRELDQQLGELLDLLPEDVTLLMMSDHGFGGTGDQIIYANCWLREQGFAKFRGGLSRFTSRTLDAIKMRAVALLPAKVKRLLYRFGRQSLGSIESRVRFAMIDWASTEAYFEENPYYPAVWVNLKGRQPKGVVEPGQEYEAVRDRLIAALKDWTNPETGEPIVEDALRREDVYSGPCTEDAPDIIVRWALSNNYSYAFKVSSKSPDGRWLEKVDPNKPENLAYYSGKSGTHRDDGIFLAMGDTIRSNHTVEGANIVDVAPTILHLLDVPVPEHMDGHVLSDILTDEREVQVAAGGDWSSDHLDNGHYSEEEEQKINERLRALGYVD